ncbi:DUF885 family protein [Acidobacteriota bacterium]
MKKFILPFLILFVAFMCTGMLLSQENKEDTKFQKTVDKYMEAYWKFFPTAATLAGFHNFYNKLEDLSERNLAKRQEELDDFNQQLVAEIDKSLLSADLQIEHELIIDGLDLDLMQSEQLLPWEYNPLFYNNILNYTIKALINSETVPAENRSKGALERLKDMPKLLKQARENLKTPAQVFTEIAIKQFPGILNFYKTDLPQWIDQSGGSNKAKLQQSLAKVVPELEGYQAFLQNELLGRSTGTFQLREAHPRLQRNTYQNTIPVADLVAQAQADINNNRRAMFLCCLGLYPIMDPQINLDQPPSNLSEEQLRNHVIGHVLDKIKDDHVSKDEFLNKVKETVGQVKAFMMEKDFCEFMGGDLNIEAMPEEFRGKTWFRLVKPALYSTVNNYSFQIAPFNDELTDEQVTQLLEEYNNDLLPFWVVQNIYPGTFVPTVATHQNPSLIKKLYANQPLIKGWALIFREKLVPAGFMDYDIHVRLNQLKFQIRAAQDFILDINIHQSGMSKDDAIRYMTNLGFRTQAEAERNYNEIALNPGEAAYAYVGYQEILAMEKEYKNLKGDSYSLKEFMSELLRYGAIPIRNLRSKILQ